MKSFTVPPALLSFMFCSIIIFLGSSSLFAQGNEYETGVSSAAVETKETNLSLADYLRRVPGLQVRGSGENVTVMIRGGSGSPLGGNEPLYVIDRVRIGNNYNQAKDQVDVNDIRYIEVLKDVASTSLYGMIGSNGVVVIHLKKKERPKKTKRKKNRRA